jgi:ribosome recycling factor
MAMTYDSIVRDTSSAMQKALDHLRGEFKAVRTGRASTGLLENVAFDYYGARTPLKNAASITVQDASTIVIKPFDMSQLRPIAKAIQEANLGMNPIEDGKQIRLNVPPMTEENRKKIANQIKDMTEKAKITVRNGRQDANKHADALHKDNPTELNEDDHRALKDEIQNLTNKFTKLMDEALREKTGEVMKV